MQSAEVQSAAFEFRSSQRFASIWTLVNLVERAAAGVLLMLALPIVCTASIVIVVLSRQSPFVAHQRVGQAGRLLWVLKLRTIWQPPPRKRPLLIHRLSPGEAPVPLPDQKHLRVTSRFASLCRRFSIDELPQLWHVVQGDMSLIGPRPLTREELDMYYGLDAATVVSQRPGLSGLWQVKGRSRLTYSQRRRLDMFLVRKWSFPLYFAILLRTVPTVLAGKNAR